MKTIENTSSKLNFLWDSSKLLSSQSDPTKIVHGLLSVFKKYLDVHELNLFIWDENASLLKDFSKSWIVYDKPELMEHLDAIYKSLLYPTRDTQVHSAQSKIKQGKNERWGLYLPLTLKEKPFGMIELVFKTEEAFKVSEGWQLSMGIVSHQISSNILNSRLNENAQMDINFQEAIKNIAKIIESQYELKYVVPLIGEIIDRFISEHLIYIFIKDEDVEAGEEKFKLLWPSACHDSTIYKKLAELDVEEEYLLCEKRKTGLFPLIDEKQIVGAIVAYSNIDKLNKKEIDYLVQLSKQSSTTIERAKVYEQILQHATLDALTGLNNRRQFEIRLHQEVATAKRKTNPLCCMMVDVDYFKKVNDTYGHHVGDIVLKSVANIVQAQLREYDTACRYGGEEFAVLLPYTTIEEANFVAQRLRKTIANNPINIDETESENPQTVQVSVSIGVSEYKKSFKSPQQLYKNADRALYEAKNSGRNRVIVFSA